MQAFVVIVPEDEVEVASDVLWGLGVVAIEERQVASGAAIELWTSVGNEATAISEAAEVIGDRWSWRVADVDESVADNWRNFAEPTWVTPEIVICPSWRDLHVDAPLCLQIDPGPTFGMGDHPTTILSLRALANVVRGGETVLDVGCGSGVLAIAACRLGAASAYGIDISPACVEVTQANARANGVAEVVTVSTTPLADVDQQYSTVVANILAPVLIDLAADLQRVLAPGGTLVISGVLADGHDHVEAALRPLVCVDRQVMGGWAALSLRAAASD
jgi:ribosomal protein L11 methyltransferase